MEKHLLLMFPCLAHIGCCPIMFAYGVIGSPWLSLIYQNLFMKEPKCKICGGSHYKTWCFQAPKKQIKARQLAPLRKTKISSVGKSDRSKLIRQADQIFSVYIRLSHSVFGRARCVTCGKLDSWKDMQNGHYVPRRKMATRWDELNCHVQCSHCNETLGGNLFKYKIYLDTTYGQGTAEKLHMRASQGKDKITLNDIQRVIDIYTMKVANLQS